MRICLRRQPLWLVPNVSELSIVLSHQSLANVDPATSIKNIAPEHRILDEERILYTDSGMPPTVTL